MTLSVNHSKLQPMAVGAGGGFLVGFLSCATYFGFVTSLQYVGRPSSTDGLAYIFMPILCFIAGLVGLVFVIALWWLLRGSIVILFRMEGRVASWRAVACSIATLLVTSASLAIRQYQKTQIEQQAWNLRNTPGVKVNAIGIRRLQQNELMEPLITNPGIGFGVSEDLEHQSRNFRWSDRELSFNITKPNFEVLDENGPLIRHSYQGYSRLRRLYVLPVESPTTSKSYLFVFAELRDGGVVSAFSQQGDLIYEELLESCGNMLLTVEKQAKGPDVLLIRGAQPTSQPQPHTCAGYSFSAN